MRERERERERKRERERMNLEGVRTNFSHLKCQQAGNMRFCSRKHFILLDKKELIEL
jgi:hypothetical protein